MIYVKKLLPLFKERADDDNNVLLEALNKKHCAKDTYTRDKQNKEYTHY